MVTAEDVRYELRDEELEDKVIERTLVRAKNFLINWTNNELLFEEAGDLLDEVLLYIVTMRLGEDTRGRAGLTSESVAGVSFHYIQDLPEHLKKSLYRYRRSRLI